MKSDSKLENVLCVFTKRTLAGKLARGTRGWLQGDRKDVVPGGASLRNCKELGDGELGLLLTTEMKKIPVEATRSLARK